MDPEIPRSSPRDVYTSTEGNATDPSDAPVYTNDPEDIQVGANFLEEIERALVAGSFGEEGSEARRFLQVDDVGVSSLNPQESDYHNSRTHEGDVESLVGAQSLDTPEGPLEVDVSNTIPHSSSEDRRFFKLKSAYLKYLVSSTSPSTLTEQSVPLHLPSGTYANFPVTTSSHESSSVLGSKEHHSSPTKYRKVDFNRVQVPANSVRIKQRNSYPLQADQSLSYSQMYHFRSRPLESAAISAEAQSTLGNPGLSFLQHSHPLADGASTSLAGSTGGASTSLAGRTGHAYTSLAGSTGRASTSFAGCTGGASTSLAGSTGGASTSLAVSTGGVSTSLAGSTGGASTFLAGSTGDASTSLAGSTGGTSTSLAGNTGGTSTSLTGNTGGASTSLAGSTGGAFTSLAPGGASTSFTGISTGASTSFTGIATGASTSFTGVATGASSSFTDSTAGAPTSFTGSADGASSSLISSTGDAMDVAKWLRDSSGNYYCLFCDQTTKSGGYMKKHLSTHNSLQKYKCFFCSCSYKKHDSLKRHLRRVHSFSSFKWKIDERAENWHMCPVCGLSFPSERHLEIHLPSHNVDFPYICPSCPCAFIKENQLLAHYRSTHTA